MEDDWSTLPDNFEAVFSLQPTPFRLFDLPPELWLHICKLVVIKAQPICVTAACKKHDQVRIVRQPAITRTCRLLRRETLPAFYSQNEFILHHFLFTACPRQWLVAIGPQNRKALGSLAFFTRFTPELWTGKCEGMGIEVEVFKDEGRADEEAHSARVPIGLQLVALRFKFS